jgi:hypothetical protein
MTQLLKDLSSNQLHRSVKPPIFSCFGDIALAIGEHFEKYLIYAMPMLQGAAELSAQPSVGDDEMIDYNNQLRSGIFEAYSPGTFCSLLRMCTRTKTSMDLTPSIIFLGAISYLSLGFCRFEPLYQQVFVLKHLV